MQLVRFLGDSLTDRQRFCHPSNTRLVLQAYACTQLMSYGVIRQNAHICVHMIDRNQPAGPEWQTVLVSDES